MGRLIGVSASFLKPGLVGGAEHMLRNLVRGLAQAANPEDRLLLLGGPAWPQVNGSAAVQWIDGAPKRNHFVEAWSYVRRYLPQLDAVLLPNYFTPPVRARRARIVTVIHDLKYLHLPDTVSLQKRLWLRAAHELTLRLADAVVVISHFVREDLLRAYGARWDEKVHVIPNPISWDRFDEGQPGPNFRLPQGRYVLSVAAQYQHKNLETLIRAFALLLKRSAYKDVSLVLAGQLSTNLVGIAQRPDIQGLITTLDLERSVHVTGYISDRDVGMYYRKAAAFIFPSLFEGCGMPAVEALGFGLPVITTRCAALPESTRRLAYYVDDALDEHELAAAMATVLDDRNAHLPSAAAVHELRDFYSVEAVGAQYYTLLTCS